jgi:hypothetical protein
VRFGQHVVKFYNSTQKLTRAAAASARMTRAGIPGSRLLAVSERVSATAQTFVLGVTPNTLGAAATAGGLLRRLHGLEPDGAPLVGPARRLAEAKRTAAVLAAVAPPLHDRVAGLVARLEQDAPSVGAVVCAHGDFEPGQLISGTELSLVDLDDSCVAPPADDLAWYSAHAARGHEDDADAVREVLDMLLSGYGAVPHNLSWYLSASILARAAFPFRSQEPNWLERVEHLVAAAEVACER